jgi:hypothetical protein
MKIGHSAQWMKGTISLVLVDNLGSNGIGGFMESFSAQRPCRFCMGLLDEFQSKVIFVTFIIYVVTKAAVLMTCFNDFIQCFQYYLSRQLTLAHWHCLLIMLILRPPRLRFLKTCIFCPVYRRRVYHAFQEDV